MSLKAPTIRSSIIAAMLGVIGLVLTMIAVVFFYQESAERRTLIREEAETVASAYEQDFLKILVLQDASLAADVARRLQSQKDLQNVLLFDSNGRIAFAFHQEGAPAISALPTEASARAAPESDIVQTYLPVSHENRRYGSVYIAASAAVRDNPTAKIVTLAWYLLIPLALVAVAAVLIIQRKLTLPLRQLTQTVQRVGATQDYSIRVPLRGEREFLLLCEEINSMLAKIEHCSTQVCGEMDNLKWTLAAIGVGVVAVDRSGRILLINPAAERILGCTNSAASGSSITELFVTVSEEKESRVDNPTIDCLKTRAPVGSARHKLIMRHSGEVRVVEESANPVWDSNGEIVGAVLTLRDASHSAVPQDAASKARSGSGLDSGGNVRTAFLSSVTHEIRSPMTSILGYAESLLDFNLTSAERLDNIKAVIRNGQQLQRVIDDILDLSKLEAGQLTFDKRPMGLAEMLGEVAAIANPRAAEKGVSVNLRCVGTIPETICTDVTRLRQCLVLLADNAIKFTASGRVTIEVRCNADLEEVLFDVQDTGTGIQLPSSNTPATDEQTKGSDWPSAAEIDGVQLSLAKKLAQALGGDIKLVHSRLNEGTRYRLVARTGSLAGVKMIDTLGTAAPAGPEGRSSNRRLTGRALVVDDNKDIQNLLKLYVQHAGMAVELANNGSEAVDKALAKPFDVIITDIQMPVMDGYAAISRLRQSAYDRPIIAMTANGFPEERERCLQYGANDFLAKPINYQQLLGALQTLLAPSDTELHDETPIVSEFSDDVEMLPLIEGYVSSLPDKIRKVEQAIRVQDWAEAKRQVHDLKGTGGNFGFVELSEVAASMDSDLREHKHDRIEALYGKLASIVARVQAGHLQAEHPEANPIERLNSTANSPA